MRFRVPKAREEIEVPSDHALQWLEDPAGQGKQGQDEETARIEAILVYFSLSWRAPPKGRGVPLAALQVPSCAHWSRTDPVRNQTTRLGAVFRALFWPGWG